MERHKITEDNFADTVFGFGLFAVAGATFIEHYPTVVLILITIIQLIIIIFKLFFSNGKPS